MARTALDGFDQLGAAAAHHQSDGVAAVGVGVLEEVAEAAVGLAAAAGAAEENFEHRAGDEGALAVLGAPDLYWTVGGGVSI